jgi:hypothetical protein
MNCNLCLRKMINVGGTQHETGWVCICRNHCVDGPMHGAPIWHPMLSLLPSASVAHASIWGALRILDLIGK